MKSIDARSNSATTDDLKCFFNLFSPFSFFLQNIIDTLSDLKIPELSSISKFVASKGIYRS